MPAEKAKEKLSSASFQGKVCTQRGTRSKPSVQYYPWFQASTGGLGTYPLWTRETRVALETSLREKRSSAASASGKRADSWSVVFKLGFKN